MEAKACQFLRGFLLPWASTEHHMWVTGHMITPLPGATRQHQPQFLQTMTYVNINIQVDIFSTQYKYRSQLLSCASSQSIYWEAG